MLRTKLRAENDRVGGSVAAKVPTNSLEFLRT
jgi:hypothetical protein